MSMNFYWAVEPIALPTGETIEVRLDDPRVHLGKITNNDFYWAQDPERAREIIRVSRPAHLIMDEGGGRWTCQEFLDRIASLRDRTEYIGDSFC